MADSKPRSLPAQQHLDSLIASDVLGWRLDQDDSWLDRTGDLTGYVMRLPSWWLQTPIAWRARMEHAPRLWQPSSNTTCFEALQQRLRINGYRWHLTPGARGLTITASNGRSRTMDATESAYEYLFCQLLLLVHHNATHPSAT